VRVYRLAILAQSSQANVLPWSQSRQTGFSFTFI